MSSIGAVGVGVRSRVMLDDTDDDVDEYVDQDVQNCANDFIERNGIDLLFCISDLGFSR